MIFLNELGSFLYSRRKEIGYTQEIVAEIIGVSARTLRNIEYNYTTPEFENIIKLWDLYELEPERLFEFYSRDEIMNEMALYYYKKRKEKILTGESGGKCL